MGDDCDEFEFEYTKITKTTRTIQNRRLSEKRQSTTGAEQVQGINLLYGKDLHEYDHLNVEELLNKLTPEEIEQLSGEVDPDDALLPADQRCRDQTTKSPTGPLNRKKLLDFLTKFALEQEDWPELKAHEIGVKRGKVFVPKVPNEERQEEKIVLDLDDDSESALNGATEADLVDLAGILGLHSMLNQDQFHNSILNKGQKIGDRFESIVKASLPKKVPFLPDNVTDPEKTTEMVTKNDPSLTELNWNNIKCIPRETFKRLFNGLKTNTHLHTLSLSNTGLTDGPAEKLAEALKENKTLKTLNMESNFLSGPMLRDLMAALLINQKVLEFRAANQRPQIMGNRIEMDIAKLVEKNDSILRLGLSFDVPDARNRVAQHLQQTNDNVRLKRVGFGDSK